MELIDYYKQRSTTVLVTFLDASKLYCIVLYCIVLYCIVWYCIMRPYTDGQIGPLSYRHSSGVVRNPHSALAG